MSTVAATAQLPAARPDSQMAALGVMSTPALAVNGTVVMSGAVPDVEHVKRLLGPVA